MCYQRGQKSITNKAEAESNSSDCVEEVWLQESSWIWGRHKFWHGKGWWWRLTVNVTSFHVNSPNLLEMRRGHVVYRIIRVWTIVGGSYTSNFCLCDLPIFTMWLLSMTSLNHSKYILFYLASQCLWASSSDLQHGCEALSQYHRETACHY